MPLDPDIAGWMLEFILRQLDVDDHTVNHVFCILPLPSRLPLLLKRTIFLRRLATDLRPGGSPSLRTLHTLELLDDLPPEDPAALPPSLSESMTAAYCTVALHCLADALRASTDENVSMVKAFTENLRDRVRDIERAKRPLLKGEPFRELRAGLEAALESRYVRVALMERDTRGEALEAVWVFVRVLEMILGPPFLEAVAKDVIQNNIQLGDLDLSLFKSSREGSDSDDTDEKATSRLTVDDITEQEKDCSEMKRAVSPSSCVIVDKHAGTATVGEEDVGDQPRRSVSERDPLRMSAFSKIVNDLKSSCSDLKNVVHDPLPDASRKASEILSTEMAERINSREQRPILDKLDASASSLAVLTDAKASYNEGNMDQGGNCDVQEPYGEVVMKDRDTAIETGAAKHPDGNCAGHITEPIILIQNKNSNGVPKCSLMDRNPTAHTIEWSDDSIDSLSEEFPASSSGLYLPSPKGSRVSPLKLVDYKKYAKRRHNKKWTSVEEDALTEGVEKYGKGNWKIILNSYKDIFEERKECDLKDKWRNLNRYGVPRRD